ncbi:hypothetical protein BVC80_1831g326 [Macleaya cordata]|uniref:F-box protein n=1 Tax=Macleaya cordata TaxID=56857 RepID=A0A200R7R2_MACCD|nr:hypothetical protein BVC80_1831g326 [Macleaya cordata]
MPDRVVQNYHVTDVGTGKPSHPCQPSWMAHEIQQRSNLSSQVHNHIALHDENRVNDWDSKQAATFSVHKGPCDDISEYRNAGRYERDLEVALDVPQFSNEFGVVTKARRSIFTNEKLFVNSENLKSARSELQPFPIFNVNQKMATILAPNKDQAVRDSHSSGFQYDDNVGHGNITVETSEHHFPSTMLGMAPNETELPRKEFCSQPEHILQAREHSVITHLPLERKSLPISRPPQEDLTGSTFTFVQHGFELGGTAAQSFMCRKKDTDPSSSYVESREHLGNANTHVVHDCNYRSCSRSLLYDYNMDKRFISRNSGSFYSGQDDASQQLQQVHDPSKRNLQFPISVGEQGRKTSVFSGTGFVPSHINPLEMSKPEELKHGCHSPFRMAMASPYDADRVRMCTAVDCVEGISGNSLESFQTFRHLLMTKKTDVDLYKEDVLIRESAVSNRSKGKALIDLEKEDVRDRKTGSLGIKNESSADTDTMDIEIYEKRKYFKGITSFPSNKESCLEVRTTTSTRYPVLLMVKPLYLNHDQLQTSQDLMLGQNPAKLQETLSSSRKTIGKRKTETNLFDLNQKPPSFLTSAKSMENMDLSTSMTESFDGEHSLSHVVQLENFNSNLKQDSQMGLDPSGRRVKHLKLTASDSVGHGTKNLRTEEASSVEKVSVLSNKSMDYSRTGKEQPVSGKHLGKEHVDLGKTIMLSNRGSSSMESVKERLDRTMSNSWIRRWCHNNTAAPFIKPSAPADCKSKSKETLHEFQTKQLPSIAAMALMGKAMTGFQECEFTDKGSYVVWNSGEI